MRLRLTILRHKLPPADLLWPVSEDKAHRTLLVSTLLEEINHVVPLENEHWALDDYAVEVGDFEALHFQSVTDIFKDEDRVCIRPLTTTEFRARRMSGRYQINANGQHLIDGIPFTKPYLRRLDRPAVKIPPGKDASTQNAFDAVEGLPDSDNAAGTMALGALLGADQQEQDHETDEEEDEDYTFEEPARKRQKRELARPNKPGKSVRFKGDRPNRPTTSDQQALVALPSDVESEEEDQSDTEMESDDEGSSSSGPSSSDSASSSDVSSVAESEKEDVQADSANDSSVVSSESENSSGISSEDKSEASSSDSSSEEDSSESEPEELPSKLSKLQGHINATTASNRNERGERVLSPRYPQNVPPGQGKRETQGRNRRRRDALLLKKLKSSGRLPQYATLADLRKFMGSELNLPRPYYVSTEPSFKGLARKAEKTVEREVEPYAEQEADDEDETAMAEDTRSDAPEKPSDLEQRRQRLLEAINSGGVEIDPKNPEAINPIGGSCNEADEAMEDIQGQAANDSQGPSAPERPRRDMDPSRRMIFKSLGLRTPKNKADEDKLRNQLTANVSMRGRKKLRVKSQVQEDVEEEEPPDPVLWKKKVKLMGFECADESVKQLSAPPFPFEQRWDPQQQFAPENTKKRKRKNREKYFENSKDEQEYYSGFFEDGNADGEWGELNYDEEGEAAQSQLLQETEGAQNKPEPALDLPYLPKDMTTLSALSKENIRPGAVVAFKQMEVTQETGWAPMISDFRTAKVLEFEDGWVIMELASRDRPHKVIRHDKNGKRIFDKFEMDVGEEEEDIGKVEIDFDDLLEAKLLRAAPKKFSDDEEAMDDGVADAQTGDVEGLEASASPVMVDAQENGVEES